MTGYHITVGYNSTLNAPERREAFETLKAVVASIRNTPEVLLEEFRRVEQRNWTADWQDYVQRYRAGDDHTITVIEPTSEEPGQVMQLASGGGDGREIKEALRRAFCRLVIAEMHRRGIEVNLVVA